MVVMAEEEVMMMDMISNLMYRIEGRGPGLMYRIEGRGPGLMFIIEGRGPGLMFIIEGRGPGLMFMCKCVEQCSPGIVK